MNVYDFDKTIYHGDSTVDFYFHCLKKYPEISLLVPGVALRFLKYKRGKITKTQFKEHFYKFLTRLPDAERETELFWDGHIKDVHEWYMKNRRDDDVIISASPEFLVRGAAGRIGINEVIASAVDPKTGKYTGVNCYGDEKVRRFYKRFPNGEINEFYSDSYSDSPLARLAKSAFIVNGETVRAWEEKKS